MGLFDHLFKSKSPPAEEKSVEPVANPADPAKSSELAEGGAPPPKPDPSAFLHPKSFVPRGASPLVPPGKSGAVSGVRKPVPSPVPPRADEIVLTLGDVLSRIPTHYLRPGQHDAKREMRFSINDLSSDIARGRAAVPLSRIAELLPDIFVKQISHDEDMAVRLPLQKLVEQIGLLRSGTGGDKAMRPAIPPPPAPAPSPVAAKMKIFVPASAPETAEPARETLRQLRADAAPVLELKPAASAAAPSLESLLELKPAAEIRPAAQPPISETSTVVLAPPKTPEALVATAPAPAPPEITVAATATAPAETPKLSAESTLPVTSRLAPEVPKESAPVSTTATVRPEIAVAEAVSATVEAPKPSVESTPPVKPETASEAAKVSAPAVATAPVQPEIALAESASVPLETSKPGAESAPAVKPEITPEAPKVSVPTSVTPPEILPKIAHEPPSQVAESAVPVAPAASKPAAVEAGEADVSGEKIHLSLAALLRQCPREIIVGELPHVPDHVRIALPFAPIDRQLVYGHVEVSAVQFVAALPFSYQKYFSARFGVKVPIPLEEVFQNFPNPDEAADSGPPQQILAPAGPGVALTPPIEITPTAVVPAAELSPVAEAASSPPAPSATSPPTTVPEVAPPAPSAPPPPPLDLPAAHHFVPPPLLVIADPNEPPMVLSGVGAGQAATVLPAAQTPPASAPVQAEPQPQVSEATALAPVDAPAVVGPAANATSPVEPVALTPLAGKVEEREVKEPAAPATIAPATSIAPPIEVVPNTPASNELEKLAGKLPEKVAATEARAGARTEGPTDAGSPAAMVPKESSAKPEQAAAISAIPSESSQKPADAIVSVEPLVVGTGAKMEQPAEAGSPVAMVLKEPHAKPEQAAAISSVPAETRQAPAVEIADVVPRAAETGAKTEKPAEAGIPAVIAPEETPAKVEPSEASSSVFAEANRLILPPPFVRPFIVLPPPILGFTAPLPKDEVEQNLPEEQGVSSAVPSVVKPEDVPRKGESQDAEKETIADKFTGLESIDFAPEIPEPTAPQAAETPAVTDELPAKIQEPVERPVPPRIISIDFSEALISDDEPKISELPLEAPATAPTEGAPIEAHDIEVVAVSEPPAAELAPAATPVAESAEPVAADAPPSQEPVPAVASSELPVAAAAPPEEAVVAAAPSQEPPIASTTEPTVPETVAPSAGVAPEPVAKSEVAIPAALTPRVMRIEVEPLPFLPLPKLDLDPPRSVERPGDEVLHPPSLPIQRFNQDALQSIFMTDDTLDLPKISRLAAQLPGVHACVIATRDQACTGGLLPDGFDLAALLSLAPRVEESAERLPIGGLKHFTLYGERYSVSFFERNGLSLCAVHRPRSFVPGVREKLVSIADELSKG